MLRNSTPGRHPCNSTAVVPREMEQFVQQSQAWTWALIRPRIGSQGPRWWEAPVELFVPHIFPPTRRQSGHDVALIVSFVYGLPLQTKLSVLAARRTLASTHLQAIHYSGTVAAVSLVKFLGSSPLDSRSLAVLRQTSTPCWLPRYASVCSRQPSRFSLVNLRHHLLRRRTISVLAACHTLRVLSAVIEYGLPVAADRRRASSQTRRDGTGPLLRDRRHHCNVSSSLPLPVSRHTIPTAARGESHRLTVHRLWPALGRARHTPNEHTATPSTDSSPSSTPNTQTTGQYGSSAPKGQATLTRPSTVVYGTTPGLTTTRLLSGWCR